MKKNLPLVLVIVFAIAIGVSISMAQDYVGSSQTESPIVTPVASNNTPASVPSSAKNQKEAPYLKLTILRCIPDAQGVGTCPPIGPGGLCEEQASRATEFTAHGMAVVATPVSGEFSKPLTISYSVTAVDEQGLDVLVVPTTVHNKLKAPFTAGINLAFTASLQPGEYKIIVNAESPDAGTTFQASTPLIIADSAHLLKNPEYCNAVMDAK